MFLRGSSYIHGESFLGIPHFAKLDASTINLAITIACFLSVSLSAVRRLTRTRVVVTCIAWFVASGIYAAAARNLVADKGPFSNECFVICVCCQLFSAVWSLLLLSIRSKLHPDDSSPEQRSFNGGYFLLLVLGIASFGGQMLSLMSLSSGAPVAVTFLTKTLEPISTAILSMICLRLPSSFALMFGLLMCVSGSTLLAAHQVHDADKKAQLILAASLALASNVGFSIRAVLGKGEMINGVGTLRVYSRLSVAAVVACPVVFLFANFPKPHLTPINTDLAVLLMSTTTYTLASFLVLTVLRVEEHSLLVNLKGAMVSLAATKLAHEPLTTSMIGSTILIFCGGSLFEVAKKWLGTHTAKKQSPSQSPWLIATLGFLVLAAPRCITMFASHSKSATFPGVHSL